jgi:hypothetical protein
MAGGYKPLKTGVDAYVEKIRNDDRQTNALRSAAGLLSAIIGKGGITVTDGGEIVAEGGNIRAIDSVTKNALAYFGKLLPPYKSGLLTATDDGVPFFWAAVMEVGTRVFQFTGGSAAFNVTTYQVNATSHRVEAADTLSLGSTARIDATDNIMLNTPTLKLYGVGDTGTAANLVLDVIGGIPILKRVASSDRYKTAVAPVEVDVEQVLAYQAITWLHLSTLEETPVPYMVRRNVGHHAEDMDRFPTLRQFVNYNDEGKPDSVQEGRFEVALHEVLKVVHARVVQLEKNQTLILAHLGLDPNELGA